MTITGNLVDTSVFIHGERADLDVGSLLQGLGAEPIALATITASELLTGIYRARTPEQRNRRTAFVEGVLAKVPTIPFDLREARTHAHLSAELSKAPVGTHDLLIAATAITHGYRVITLDERSFPRIPGLVTLIWPARR